MIAKRFRSVGWAAAAAVAAVGFYCVSLRVATERNRLESVDRQIVSTRRDIRRLQTELGTRASLRQLEQWNGDVLALSAPSASQYLKGETQLASLDAGQAIGAPNGAPPSVTRATASAAPQVLAASATAPAQIVPTSDAPRLQHANYVRPIEGIGDAHIQTVALTRLIPDRVAPKPAKAPAANRVLDDRTLGDLVQTAAREGAPTLRRP